MCVWASYDMFWTSLFIRSCAHLVCHLFNWFNEIETARCVFIKTRPRRKWTTSTIDRCCCSVVYMALRRFSWNEHHSLLLLLGSQTNFLNGRCIYLIVIKANAVPGSLARNKYKRQEHIHVAYVSFLFFKVKRCPGNEKETATLEKERAVHYQRKINK